MLFEIGYLEPAKLLTNAHGEHLPDIHDKNKTQSNEVLSSLTILVEDYFTESADKLCFFKYLSINCIIMQMFVAFDCYFSSKVGLLNSPQKSFEFSDDTRKKRRNNNDTSGEKL